MAIDRLEFAPGARFNGVPHSAGTKEYFHCVSGEIQLTIAGELYELAAGDVIAFPGEATHAYANPGAEAALGLSVVVLAPEHT
jgi:quercetin dioxygenase-like cupin family protein